MRTAFACPVSPFTFERLSPVFSLMDRPLPLFIDFPFSTLLRAQREVATSFSSPMSIPFGCVKLYATSTQIDIEC